MNDNVLGTKAFSKVGPRVTMVGLGGEGVLRTHKLNFKAREVIQTAIEQGITYFESFGCRPLCSIKSRAVCRPVDPLCALPRYHRSYRGMFVGRRSHGTG